MYSWTRVQKKKGSFSYERRERDTVAWKKLQEKLDLGPDASFEEQFDHIVANGGVEGGVDLEYLLMPWMFSTDDLPTGFRGRLTAATSLYHLTEGLLQDVSEKRIKRIRDLGTLLVGGHYYRWHTETPIEMVRKLREAKAIFLGPNRQCGPYGEESLNYLADYFCRWEIMLTEEEVKIY